MGFQIEDGTGSGRSAGVSKENKLQVMCVAITNEHHINHHEKQAYSLGVQQTPTGAGDCFCYIKNTKDDDMMISAVMLATATDEYIIIKLGDEGTALSGTTATPVNRNAGSGNEADCTAEVGNNITGLSGGSGVMRLFIDGGTSSKKYELCSSLIVPKNKTVSFYAVTGSILITMGVAMFFHSDQSE